jgi:hypothetical protein
MNVLLTTATIVPPKGATALVVTDPKQRLLDYQGAFRLHISWLGTLFDRIVFAENSQSDVTSLKDIAAEAKVTDRVEFVSFNGLNYPPINGRGYGEFLLIDEAMKRSSQLAALGPSDIIWKLTGRYRVLNMPAMVASATKPFDLYLDLKDRSITGKRQAWSDLRLFAFTKPGYARFLKDAYVDLNESTKHRPPAVSMRHRMTPFLGDATFTPRFTREPLVDGIRGVDGQNYWALRNRWKYVVRSATRAWWPRLWI